MLPCTAHLSGAMRYHGMPYLTAPAIIDQHVPAFTLTVITPEAVTVPESVALASHALHIITMRAAVAATTAAGAAAHTR